MKLTPPSPPSKCLLQRTLLHTPFRSLSLPFPPAVAVVPQASQDVEHVKCSLTVRRVKKHQRPPRLPLCCCLFLSLFICLNGISYRTAKTRRETCYIWGNFFFFFLQLGSDPLVLSIVALSLLQLMRTQRKHLCCHEVGRHAKASFKDHETLMMARGQRRSRTR